MRFKKLGFIFLFLIIAVLVVLYYINASTGKNKAEPVSENKKSENSTQKPETASVLSTNPSPLDGTIIQADQIIEIRFSDPIQNPDEFRHTITPKADYKIELIDNKKTVKITPLKPFPLGDEYTIRVSPETKFDTPSKLPDEKIFHFKTVSFRGF